MPIQMENVQITSYQLGSTEAPIGPPINFDSFIQDPVGALRRQGVAVSVTTEAAWRQLGAAIQTLQRSHSSGAQRGAYAHPDLYLNIWIPIA